MSETIKNINQQETYISPSDLTSNLIGQPSGWILYTGISLIGLLISILLIGSYFIEYPDEVIATGIITTEIPPLQVENQYSSIISKIYVKNLDTVSKGQELLYLKNTSIKADVEKLIGLVGDLEKSKSAEDIIDKVFPNNLILGDLSQTYANLILQKEVLHRILTKRSIHQKVESLGQEIEQLKKLNVSIENERSIFKKEIELIIHNTNRNRTLLVEGVISELEFEDVQKIYLQHSRQYEGMGSGIIKNEVRIQELEYQIANINEEYQNSIEVEWNSIKDLLLKIKEEYRIWFDRYHIIAEMEGRIELSSSLEIGSNIESSKRLGNIIPVDKSPDLMAKAYISSDGLGKVKLGDMCILRIRAYP